MSSKERRTFYTLSVIFVISSVWMGGKYYFDNTKEVPANGGEYIEAEIGQTRFINPILSQTNDVDADISSLVFSSLLRTDSEGKLKNDLAESYEISEDKLTYTFRIKQNVFWHDGQKLTADDVIYTVKTVQDDSYYSPLIANWKGVRAEKVDDYTVKFILKSTYTPFLNNLTFGVLPQHLWDKITANEFPLSELNFKPVGSGPYKFDSFKKDKNGKIISLSLIANSGYYAQAPYIKKITFKFYPSEDEAVSALNRKEVKGINYISPDKIGKIADSKNKNIYRLQIPRYYGIFFNQTQSKALSDKNVRLAIAYAINKDKLISEVLKGEGEKIETPIPKQLLGYNPDAKTYGYSPDQARSILDTAGWVDSNNDGIREKNGGNLEFTLVTTDWPGIPETAQMIQSMCQEIGISVKLVATDDIQGSYIKTRSYEAVLYGAILNYDPDPFSFWHSSQKKDPGLNLALYDNPQVDKILEEARKETNNDIRAQKYKDMQNIIIEDEPAIFLYSPAYLYVQDKSIKKMEARNIIIPSDRFNDIESWYIKTKRVAK